MSSNEWWECGDCHAPLQASRTATRHWKDKVARGAGHQGPVNIIHHPGGPVAAAPVVFLSPPPPPSSSPPLLPPSQQPVRLGGDYTDGPLQLRSSRSTRNQDHQATSRNRPGVVDLDPTEGLPVQKWVQAPVKFNQDPPVDPASVPSQPTGTTATSSAEWAAQFNTPQFPWPEKPLPSFFSQLSPWNQEMIRRARAGNTNPKLSTWDSKTNSWNSGAEAEMRQNAIKSGHFTNQDSNNGANRNTAPESPAHGDDDDHEEKSDNDSDGGHADDVVGAKESGVKRRKKYIPEERTFETKRWVHVPSAVADKTEERTFLADRRPGMPSLYGGAYQNQVFGSMGLNTNGYGFSAANAGYDLGDGGGLANAAGLPQSNEDTATPVRKNMPPKRKKKKGGPGRKKANPSSGLQSGANDGTGVQVEGQNIHGSVDGKPAEDIIMGEGDNDGSDSGSEAEGSEEGEIDEGGHDHDKEDGAAAHPIKAQDGPSIETKIPNIMDQFDGTASAPNSDVETDKDITMATEDTNNIQSDVHTAADSLPADTVMQDIKTAELSNQAPTETEIIPSITYPPVSEQLPEVQPSEPDPVSVQEISPVPAAILPGLTEQAATPAQTDGQNVPIAPVDGVPGLDAVPVQSASQLPPITTTIAEAMDQPSISAPGLEPVTMTSTPPLAQSLEPVSIPDANLPAQTPAQAVPPAPAPTPITTAIDQALPKTADQEPTSPDLLGGLEDELNKNMGEETSQ